MAGINRPDEISRFNAGSKLNMELKDGVRIERAAITCVAENICIHLLRAVNADGLPVKLNVDEEAVKKEVADLFVRLAQSG